MPIAIVSQQESQLVVGTSFTGLERGAYDENSY